MTWASNAFQWNCVSLFKQEAEFQTQTSKGKEVVAHITEEEGKSRYLLICNEVYCIAMYTFCLKLSEAFWLLVLNVFKIKNLLTSVVMQGSNFSGVSKYWSS